MVKSKFQQWFEKQFGTRARRFKTLSDFQLQEKVEGCRSDLEEAVEEQQRRTRWDAQFQAALYAKQASPVRSCPDAGPFRHQRKERQ